MHIDVVTPELATLPRGWQKRLKPLRAGRVVAYCLEVHDLAVSKLAAGRLKDMEFVAALLHLGLAQSATIQRRIGQCASTSERLRLQARLQTIRADLAK